jgi:hypothetical protein
MAIILYGFRVDLFLPLFSPLARHNREVFLGVPEFLPLFKIHMPIVIFLHSHSPHAHAHHTNHETHYVMEHASYRPLY